MAMDPDYLLNLPPRITYETYAARDTALYALGIGAGQTAPEGDRDDLRYVYEDGLVALPTMSVVLAYPGFWQKEPEYGIDWKRILHAEQAVEFHRPLPVAGTVRGELTVDRIIDKGAEKGALIYSKRLVYDDATNDLLATITQVSFARGDGGRGGSPGEQPKPHPVPESEPDARVVMASRPEQALIYRLSGDYNPLHADPAVAADAGLPRPILHGLCTYGFAGRALVAELCGNDPARLTRMNCRFSAPVFPGETIETSIWRESPGCAAFRARVVERDLVVLTNGYAEYRD